MSDFSEVEQELKKLRPLAPTTEFTSRVALALHSAPSPTPGAGVVSPPKTSSWKRAAGWSFAAFACALLLLLRINSAPPATTKQSLAAAHASSSARDEFAPAELTRVVLDSHDDGLIYDSESGQPSRRTRYRRRETWQWHNASTGASLRVSYPSEEVVVRPIIGQ